MNEPYSYHHFFFPFRWDVLPAGFRQTQRKEGLSFDERTRLGKFHEHITQEHWQHKQFSFKNDDGSFNHIHYNEFTYYHDFVRKVVYDYRLPYHQSEEDYHKLGEVGYYEYRLQEGREHLYIIHHKSSTVNIPAELKLRVQGISLHAFNTGIGILSFYLANDLYKNEGAIRHINEYGRRIYPQFMRPAEEGFVTSAKYAFLPDELELVLNDAPLPIENFEAYAAQCSVEEPFVPPAFFKTLFGAGFLFCVKEDLRQDSILISRVLDDRMFFLCWYGNNRWSRIIKSQDYRKSDWWYGFIFGDKQGSNSIANAELQYKQAEAHTYTRWINYGTLFGMSRDSFVCISQTAATLRSNYAPPLHEHMNSIYYTMVVLCLAQRASLLKFSAEVAYLGDISGKRSKELLSEVKDLHRNYIEFVNKIYFREVTSQIQGIELYSQLQGIMQIPEDAKDLEREIGNLFNYVRLEAEEQETNALNRLQKIGFPLLITSLVIGLMGINAFQEPAFIIGGTPDWQKIACWSGLAAGVGIGSYLLLKAAEWLWSKRPQKNLSQ